VILFFFKLEADMPKIVSLQTPHVKLDGLFLEEKKESALKEVKQYTNTVALLEKKIGEKLLVLTTAAELTLQQKQALVYTEAICKELLQDTYSTDERKIYAEWAVRLLTNYLTGKCVEAEHALDALVRVCTSNDLVIKKASKAHCGHNPLYYIRTKSQGADAPPDALIKDVSHLSTFSSFSKQVKNFPLSSTVDMHELAGYEIDAILGLSKTPPTLSAAITLIKEGKKETHKAIIQKFIQNSKAGGSGYLEEKDGAKMLLTLDRVHAQIAAMSGIIKGRGAGHMDNYLMQEAEDNKKIDAVYDIDLEECLIPFNRFSTVCNLSPCRMWILGLPQNKRPLDRAMLLILAHPVIPELVSAHVESLKKHYTFSKEALCAYKERVELIQKQCMQALQKNTLLTPRDVYFTIFGGRELYHLAKQKGYSDLAAFNNIISDPYQHVIKDYTRPEKMKRSKSLQKPKTKSPKKRNLFENLTLLEAEAAVYTNNLKNWIFGFEKASGLNDRK